MFVSLFVLSMAMSQIDSPTTNSGEPFVDPFAEEIDGDEDIDVEVEPESEPESDFQEPDFEEPDFETQEDRLEQESEAPVDEAPVDDGPLDTRPAIEDFELSPDPQSEESFSPPSPSPEEEPDFEAPENFEFPDVEEPEGPISQDVRDQVYARSVTDPGEWHMGVAGGFAGNVNRRPNQVHTEIYGGYRLLKNFDLDALISLRFRKQYLLGMYVVPRYYFRVTDSDSLRIEIAPHVGMGWTLVEAGNKFREGRFSMRFGVDGLFYINPSVSITSTLAMDSYFFAVDTNGEAVNLFKAQGDSSGPPTALLALGGVRFEF